MAPSEDCTCAALPWRRKGRRRVMRSELCSLSFINLLILKKTVNRWGRRGEGGSERQAADHHQLCSGHSLPVGLHHFHHIWLSRGLLMSGLSSGNSCILMLQGNDPLKVLHTIFNVIPSAALWQRNCSAPCCGERNWDPAEQPWCVGKHQRVYDSGLSGV